MYYHPTQYVHKYEEDIFIILNFPGVAFMHWNYNGDNGGCFKVDMCVWSMFEAENGFVLSYVWYSWNCTEDSDGTNWLNKVQYV